MEYMSVWNDSLINCGKSEVYNNTVKYQNQGEMGMIYKMIPIAFFKARIDLYYECIESFINR